jgi:glyoxylase-like metal-dependent hydrolase (beta-lactamase superfamily II)
VTHLPTEYAKRPELEYPFGLRWSPEPGQPFEVVDGVYWLRVPLPISLDHINLWILRDGDGWTIVDSGYDADMCRDVWEQVFDTFLEPASVNKIIVTHFHPDHIGLASWLALRCECPVLISKGEFDLYNNITTRDKAQFRKEAQQFVTELGYDADVGTKFVQFMSSGDKPAEARVQASMCEFIADGDRIKIDGRDWQVVSGNGHSPEHSCLFNVELNALISGDQSIPRISSNVSVYPSNRHEDPLGDWLSSCEKLRDMIPNDTLILPSHQEPFRNNKARMQQLIDDHQIDLNRLRLAVDSPISPVEARAIMFNRELSMIDILLATGETLAHLNYLLHRNELEMSYDPQGVARYFKA